MRVRISWRSWVAILALIVAGGIVMTIGFVLYPTSAMNDFGGHMPMTEAELLPGILIVSGAVALMCGAMLGMNRIVDGVVRGGMRKTRD